MILENAVVNFLGDSITDGTGASCMENRYTNVLERMFHLKAANNYGIGGSRIARQQTITDDPRDLDFCMRMADMDRQADAVVVFGGTNDYGWGENPLGTPDDTTPATFYGGCNFLMDGLLTQYAGKPILIVTPLHRLNEDSPDGDGSKHHDGPPLRAYCDILVEQHSTLACLCWICIHRVVSLLKTLFAEKS